MALQLVWAYTITVWNYQAYQPLPQLQGKSAMTMDSTTQLISSQTPDGRSRFVRAGIAVEIVTVVWMCAEAALALGAGLAARSVLLTAFGLDSVIELVTGGVLLWRLVVEARNGPLDRVERAERRAAWVVGIGLILLCVYIVVTSALGLLTQTRAESSPLGIAVAGVAIVGMPLLAWRKRAIANALDSSALRGDAACSVTCAYMAGALLVGLLLNALFGWWWADSLAALGLLYWLIPEAREALEGARAGRAACACGDDDCDE
jgi:divalent metal cation (Fe/Co/Zn/Cd) transporter